MIIEALRDYMLNCPILDEDSPLNVDYLDISPTNYTIDGVPAEVEVVKYVDGGSINQFIFVFASTEYYGPDVIQNIENSGFYERISKWFKEQSKVGNLPVLPNHKALKIETLTSGYLFNSTEDSARYQLQARLLYYEN